MSDANTKSAHASPFHRGEQWVQTRVGVREKMESIGPRFIRDYLPEQHQAFYRELPYVFVGHVDEAGQPWASVLATPKGLIIVNDEKHLTIAAKPLNADPLARIQTGQKVGVLGIDLSTKRRNRLTATVAEHSSAGMTLAIEQTFGNCPQYIHPRPGLPSSETAVSQVESLPSQHTFDADMQALIRHADTFFVASYYEDLEHPANKSNGADVSHRGGNPGFVRIDSDQQLTIPDYRGNQMFSTLGNIHQTGKAGLLFIDFENGDVLSMTGRASILWQAPDATQFAGAQRLWLFRLTEARWLKRAVSVSNGAR
jgi:predicted pyridoxine 5'-phosphate oxidase superfamily flavin-nucleotide-binding protein